MAIQFLQRPDDSRQYEAIGLGLGSLLSGLGSYGIQKIMGDEDQEVKRLVDAQIMSPEQAKIYKKMRTPQERSSFMNQIIKQNETARKDAIFREEMARAQGMPIASNLEKNLGSLGGEQIQAQMPFDTFQSAQRLLAQGVDPQRVNLLANLTTGQEKLALQKEALQAKKEAPHRAQVAKQIAEYQRKAELADRLLVDYKSMKSLADHPELRTGVKQQFFSLFNIPEALQSDASFVADKLIGDITLASASSLTTPGKMTAQLLKQIAKINPSRLSTPQGIKDTLTLKEMSARVEKIVGDKISEIVEKSPNGIPPINIIQRAQKEARPEIEKIHEEQENFARKMVEDAKKSNSSSLKIGKTYSGMPDPSKIARYRDPITGIIMKRNAEGTGFIPE